jgi:hypothetical protein
VLLSLTSLSAENYSYVFAAASLKLYVRAGFGFVRAIL